VLRITLKNKQESDRKKAKLNFVITVELNFLDISKISTLQHSEKDAYWKILSTMQL